MSGSLVEGLIKQAGCFSVTALRGLSRSGRSWSAEKPGKLPAAPRSYLKWSRGSCVPSWFLYYYWLCQVHNRAAVNFYYKQLIILVIFQVNLPNTCCLQLPQCKDWLLVSVIYESKWRVLDCWLHKRFNFFIFRTFYQLNSWSHNSTKNQQIKHLWEKNISLTICRACDTNPRQSAGNTCPSAVNNLSSCLHPLTELSAAL